MAYTIQLIRSVPGRAEPGVAENFAAPAGSLECVKLKAVDILGSRLRAEPVEGFQITEAGGAVVFRWFAREGYRRLSAPRAAARHNAA